MAACLAPGAWPSAEESERQMLGVGGGGGNERFAPRGGRLDVVSIAMMSGSWYKSAGWEGVRGRGGGQTGSNETFSLMIKWKMARSDTPPPLRPHLLPDSNLYTVYYRAIRLMRSVNLTSYVIHIKNVHHQDLRQSARC